MKKIETREEALTACIGLEEAYEALGNVALAEAEDWQEEIWEKEETLLDKWNITVNEVREEGRLGI